MAAEVPGALAKQEFGWYFCLEMEKRVHGLSNTFGDLAISDDVAREFLEKLC